MRLKIIISISTILTLNLISNELHITIPTPPKPTEPIEINLKNGNEDISDRTIKFSKRYPPNYTPLEERISRDVDGREGVGDITNGRVSVNLVGGYLDVDEVKRRLEKADFKILALLPLDGNGTLQSIVFTDAILKRLASEPKRGFLATLRVL